ncbi:hypothetical protein U3516DRAFT_81280 [Neocallimastix sp. 'constans']
MKVFFFAVIIGLLALIKVNALGYICKRHIVIKHGDRCRFYNGAPNPDYRIKFSEIYHLNPNIDCDDLKSGSKICLDIDSESKKGKERFNYSEYRIPKDYNPETYTCKTLAKKLKSSVLELEQTNFPSLNCRGFKRNLKIRYRADGKYYPDFTNSTAVNYNYGKEYTKFLKSNY